MRKILVLMTVLLVFSAVAVSALDPAREERVDFGHVMRVKSVITEPTNLAPGESGLLKINIQNIANYPIYDIRVKLNLPSQISLLNDISRIKIAKLESGEEEELTYNIIVLPTTSEGVYESTYIIDYVNHIGTERQDNDTFAIVVKSVPEIFIKIEDSEIYEGKDTGEVTIRFINNDVADIKFLTVELQETGDYDIISGNKEYIGDLDSDDFESVSFRLKVLNEKDSIKLPLKISYKDALNTDYNDTLEAELNMRTAAELGKKTNGNTYIALVVILVLIVGFFIYRKFKKKHHSEHRR